MPYLKRRRSLLRSIGASVAVGIGSGMAGCVNGGQEGDAVPEPVDISGRFDDQGGMAIGDHGGPNGQVFYANNSPEGHDDPAWFHTLVSGLFPYHFDRLDRGWEAEVIYVTDYSMVELSLPEDEEGPRLPSPTAPDTFADATELTYVAESTARGGMGPTLPPFSDEDEAAVFADKYDGTTVGFDGITREFVSSLRSPGHGNGMDM